MWITAADSALSPQAHPVHRRTEPMRYGEFTITETQHFPPAAGPQCWAYVTLNAEISLSLPQSAPLQNLLKSSRVRVSVDGQWLWWGLRRKYPGQELAKMPGSDLIHDIAAYCERNGQRLLLLGSSPRANAGALQNLRQRWPGLDVAGFSPGHYEPDTPSEAATDVEMLAAIRAFSPHFVVLGLGAKKEHRLAWRLARELDGLVTGLLCFGGAIDLISGEVKRAPRLWQTLGLEGIYRVLQQPSRLWRFLKVLRVLPVLATRAY
jgi:exopolysaccharide biosynthesis WecB/TagA/CpsF family protein